MPTSLPYVDDLAKPVPNAVLTYGLHNMILQLCIGMLEPDGTSMSHTELNAGALEMKEILLDMYPVECGKKGVEAMVRMNLRVQLMKKQMDAMTLATLADPGNNTGIAAMEADLGRMLVHFNEARKPIVELGDLLHRKNCDAGLKG